MKKIVNATVIFLLSLMFLWMLYIMSTTDGDINANFLMLHKQYEIGLPTSIESSYNITNLCSRLLYPILGIDKAVVCMEFYIEIFFCCFFSFLLSKNPKGEYYIGLIVFTAYLLMPKSSTQVYHLFSSMICLYLIFLFDKWIYCKKWWIFILMVLGILLDYKVAPDFAMAGIYIILPAIVYGMIIYIHSDSRRKKVAFLIPLLIFALGIVRILCDINKNNLEFVGYGGANYANWANPASMINENIGYYFASLVSLWNIHITGPLIQLNSIGSCIRLVILICAIVVAIQNSYFVIRYGNKKVVFIDGFCSIAFIVISITQILNGVTTVLRGVARYASFTQYLLVIIIVRKMYLIVDGILESEKIQISLKYINYFMVVFSAGLILLFIDPVYYGIEFFNNSENNIDYRIGNVVVQNDLEYGVAEWYTAAGVYKESLGKAKPTPVRMYEDMDYINYNFASDALDGCNYYNYVISTWDSEQFNSESLISVFGEPINTYEITNQDGWVEASVLLYDYDVRWQPEYFYYNEEQFDNRWVPYGVSRLIVTGHDITDAEINVKKDNSLSIKKTIVSNERVIFDITNEKDEFYSDIEILTQGEVQYGIFERIYAAFDICTEQDLANNVEKIFNVDSKCDEFRLVLQGENVGELELEASNNVNLELMTKGTQHAEYRVSNTNCKSFELSIQNNTANKIILKKCSMNEMELSFPKVKR